MEPWKVSTQSPRGWPCSNERLVVGKRVCLFEMIVFYLGGDAGALKKHTQVTQSLNLTLAKCKSCDVKPPQ